MTPTGLLMEGVYTSNRGLRGKRQCTGGPYAGLVRDAAADLYGATEGLAANTINQQLAAVRRLAYEAADAGLLSPELAAGISRVKGVKQLGFRAGNWLSAA